MNHKPGIKTTEFALVLLFIAIASIMLWRYGAAIADAIKGMSYSVSSYAFARTILKRKTAACLPALDPKIIAADAAKLIDTKAIAVQLLAHLRPQKPANTPGANQ